MGDGLFHHTRRLNHLRQEHFSAAEQVTDDSHPVHHRAFNDGKAFVVLQPRLFSVLNNVFIKSLYQCVRETFFHGAFSPRKVFFADAFFLDVFDRFGELQQPVSGIGAAVEDHVFDMFQQVFGDLFVNLQLPRVDDAHIQTSFDRVVEERRVDRFTNDVVAAETEADV